MTFKPTIWHPIAVALTVINLLGLGYALGVAEPAHAAIHAVLALAFGSWARRLRRVPGESESERAIEDGSEARFEALDSEMSRLRQELSETQERLDFAERMLAQRPEPRRVDPQR
jgi:hypothetical protein